MDHNQIFNLYMSARVMYQYKHLCSWTLDPARGQRVKYITNFCPQLSPPTQLKKHEAGYKTFLCPRHFQWWGHIQSRLSVRSPYVCASVRPVRKWFPFDIFYKISELDSYFIHRYINIKYSSSSIYGKIHQFFWELWSYFQLRKMVSVWYHLKRLVYWIHILYTGIKT